MADNTLLDGFTKNEPTSVGLYQFACAEQDYKPSYVAITEDHQTKTKYVHCPISGVAALKFFHEGLIDSQWKFIV